MPATTSVTGYDLTPPTADERARLEADLTPDERRVLLASGTERPFCGGLLTNKEAGTYNCRLCDLPLFRSATKFESGTGWPSFHTSFDPAHVKEITDRSHGMVRVEIRCGRCDSHLGHVFEDGPRPTGLRYCLNSGGAEVRASSGVRRDGGCEEGERLDGPDDDEPVRRYSAVELPHYSPVFLGVLADPDAVEVLAIHGDEVDRPGPGLFRRYRAWRRVAVPGPDGRRAAGSAVAAALLTPGGGAFCFMPHHAVRAERDGVVIDLLVCFMCENAEAYGPGVDGGIVGLGPAALPALRAVLRAELRRGAGWWARRWL